MKLNLLHLRRATTEGRVKRQTHRNVSAVLSGRDKNRQVSETFLRPAVRSGPLNLFLCTAARPPGLASINKQPLCCSLSAWSVIIPNYWKKRTPDPMEKCSLSVISLSMKPQPQNVYVVPSHNTFYHNVSVYFQILRLEDAYLMKDDIYKSTLYCNSLMLQHCL